ncbi:unnamed protein product, partial [Discosporangium mesarthrocarpum]
RVRAQEIKVLLRATTLRGVNEAMFFAQPAVVGLLVFATYHYLGNELQPQKIFTTLALLNITQFTMGKFFYLAVQYSSESWVSIKRLERLLLLEVQHMKYYPIIHALSPSSISLAKNRFPQENKAVTYSNNDLPGVHCPGLQPRDSVSSISRTLSNSGRISLRQASFKWGQEEGGVGKEKGEDNASEGHQVISRGSGRGEVEAGAKGARWGGCGKYSKHGYEGNGVGAGTEGGKEGGAAGQHGVLQMSGSGSSRAAKRSYTLEDINLDIEQGQLVAVVGAVGSAKSSLLMAVLKEMSLIEVRANFGKPGSGGVTVEGNVAYASQEPWIQSGTLRENILFGKPMDWKRYSEVVSDCALERDMASLPSGDLTGIGDRGVNLSGGQKARVGLARMAYTEADVYLMDDPLSAVDPAVGRALFDRVVCGRLRGKTRLLVTHQVHYLREAAVDLVLVMNEGRIIARGRYAQYERT